MSVYVDSAISYMTRLRQVDRLHMLARERQQAARCTSNISRIRALFPRFFSRIYIANCIDSLLEYTVIHSDDFKGTDSRLGVYL